ncbi:MAG: helix-turn-helix transcriptional regulator [Bacteroidales bacterium]|nr:helix-turn-helix transcriptional regulator [Bacteroidales bacterium]
MDNRSIKENIRRIRKSRKMTQEDMAARLDISLTAYRDLERGSTNIMNANIFKIAELLDISVEELLLGYRPVQAKGIQVEDVRAEYGGQITVMERRISDLEKLVSSLEETIITKNEIISMLKKKLGEVE